MKGFLTTEQVAEIKKAYPVGTRIELDHMEGERDMPDGLQGVVKHVDDQGQLHMAWQNGRSLALVVNEDSFHVLPPVEEKNRCDRFIDYINDHLLPRIDYHALAKSCRTEEKSYAKGILNLLHTAMAQQYGTTTLTPGHANMDDDYVVIPGVIQGKKSGEIALALLGLDLASSGEHCQTDILCHYGVVSQGNGKLPPYIAAEISVDFMPYDYGYTAQIPGDIHVSRNRLPDGIKEMLSTFQNYTAELTPAKQAEETAQEENDTER